MISNSQYVGMMARMRHTPAEAARGVERESDLHNDIMAECKRRGWIAFHGSMAERTARVCGEPDFIILGDNGRVLFIECKTKSGKLSTEQLGIQLWAGKLGHKIHVVRSMDDFHVITAG